MSEELRAAAERLRAALGRLLANGDFQYNGIAADVWRILKACDFGKARSENAEMNHA